MKAERVILSIIAILIGLLVAGGAFYLYQLTRQLPADKSKAITLKTKPTPTPDANNYLVLDTPQDGEVFATKTITISGKTLPNSTLIVTTDTNDQVVKPTATGNFSVTTTIGDDSTIIHLVSIFPNGEQKTLTRTVSYTTEDF